GMDRVTVNTQSADDKPATVDGILKRLQFCVATQKFCRLTVGFSRISTTANLDRFYAQILQIVECFFKRFVRQQHGEYANLHSDLRFFNSSGRKSVRKAQTRET